MKDNLLRAASPLNIILAFDSFKGSMTALEACEAAKAGLELATSPPYGEQSPPFLFQTFSLPMADGGEGTVAAFIASCGGRLMTTKVTGPYGQPIDATYGILNDGTAIIEMAAASGLTLTGNRMNPLDASTLGTGELILHALNAGCLNLTIGLGGSATNDGGMGMAHALGVRFLDATGKVLLPQASNLAKISEIDLSALDQRIKCGSVIVTAACDVQNPLYGDQGASVVFGPQKGASPEDVLLLDESLRHFDRILRATFSQSFNVVGAGAAGGLGAGMMAFLNARYASGIDLLIEKTDLSTKLQDTHFLLTGEGALDAQSMMGKVLTGLLAQTTSQNVPVICFAGRVDLTAEACRNAGIEAAFAIKKEHQSSRDAMNAAKSNLRDAVCRWARSLVK